MQTDDQAHGGSQGHKDPASLSGGEKSFSTLCLLLSLWETCGSPIRCLGRLLTSIFPVFLIAGLVDEFDVFMDSQFRRVSISMLVRMDCQRLSASCLQAPLFHTRFRWLRYHKESNISLSLQTISTMSKRIRRFKSVVWMTLVIDIGLKAIIHPIYRTL